MGSPAKPIRCRPEAYDLFARQLTRLQVGDALVRAAVAVSMHELSQADPQVCERQMADWADQIRRRVHGSDFCALLAHAHDFLFDVLGLAGNVDDYYSVTNSYLPVVLETRRGIPITLSLIYREVLRKLGVVVHGVNTPGHFLAAVADPDGGLIFIDAFHGGRMLVPQEIHVMVEKMAGAPVPRTEDVMALATPVQWLSRLVRNLEANFEREDRFDDVTAMRDLRGLLNQVS